MQNLPVPTASGDAVPLQAVADVEFGAGPTEIRRYNQIRRVVIGVDLAPGVVNSEAMAKINALPTLNNLQIGRAHVWTPVTNAHLVCRLLLEKKNTQTNYKHLLQ